jgi:hypothetical protein
LAAAILAERTHPEQGYRSRLGLVRLERRYGAGRVDAACARALAAGARSYRHVAGPYFYRFTLAPGEGRHVEADLHDWTRRAASEPLTGIGILRQRLPPGDVLGR